MVKLLNFVSILTLLSTPAMAQSWQDQPCEIYRDFLSAAKICNAWVQKSKHHLVPEDEVRTWCSEAAGAKNALKSALEDYKQENKKAFNLKTCVI